MKRKLVLITKKRLEALLNEPISINNVPAVQKIQSVKQKNKLKIYKKKRKTNNKDAINK